MAGRRSGSRGGAASPRRFLLAGAASRLTSSRSRAYSPVRTRSALPRPCVDTTRASACGR